MVADDWSPAIWWSFSIKRFNVSVFKITPYVLGLGISYYSIVIWICQEFFENFFGGWIYEGKLLEKWEVGGVAI